MEHSYFRDRISAFKDNGLNTEEQYLISLHLKECAECRALLEKLETLDSMVARESNLSPDEYFEKLASRIDKKIAGDSAKVTDISTRSSWAGLTWKITATAASVAFLVFIGYHKDDILPPSKSASESPVIMTPGSKGNADSMDVGRLDSSARSLQSLPAKIRPPVTAFKSQSAAEGYFSDSDVGGKEDARGDVIWNSSRQEQDELQKKKTEVRRDRNSNREKSSTLKESLAKEKTFIRGGRSNEVEFELDDVSLDKAEESTKGLFQEAPRKNERAFSAARPTVLKPQPDNAPEPVDESDSNYKRPRKSALEREEVADKELFADDSGRQGESQDKRKTIDRFDEHYLSGWIQESVAPDDVGSKWITIRDSLLAVMPQFGDRRVKKTRKEDLSETELRYYSARDLPSVLFDLLRATISTSEDSLETDWAVKLIRELEKFGDPQTSEKAKLYLDSLNAARTKRDEERK